MRSGVTVMLGVARAAVAGIVGGADAGPAAGRTSLPPPSCATARAQVLNKKNTVKLRTSSFIAVS